MKQKSLLRKSVDALNRPWTWIAISALAVAGNFMMGTMIQFPTFFIVPVSLAAWHRGNKWGLALAFILPLTRFGLDFLAPPSGLPMDGGVNCVLRIFVFSIFAMLVSRTAWQTRQLEKEVQMLETMLPICCVCKKIRDQNQGWQRLEAYFHAATATKFTHTYCPDCSKDFLRAAGITETGA